MPYKDTNELSVYTHTLPRTHTHTHAPQCLCLHSHSERRKSLIFISFFGYFSSSICVGRSHSITHIRRYTHSHSIKTLSFLSPNLVVRLRCESLATHTHTHTISTWCREFISFPYHSLLGCDCFRIMTIILRPNHHWAQPVHTVPTHAPARTQKAKWFRIFVWGVFSSSSLCSFVLFLFCGHNRLNLWRVCICFASRQINSPSAMSSTNIHAHTHTIRWFYSESHTHGHTSRKHY